MKVNGKTMVCGLIGNPVEHTMSPFLHNALAEKMGKNMIYVPLLVEEGLDEAVRGAYALNISGLNITVPYKEKVCTMLAEVDPLARQIGAVNTLQRTRRGYRGYNTDMTGLYRALCSEGIKIRGEKVIILGAGGAARSVAYLCADYGAEQIFILNRNCQKARKIAEEVNNTKNRQVMISFSLDEYERLPREKMLCIQATSVGLEPNEEQVVLSEKDFYGRIHTGYDLIYRPTNTRFMQLVKEQGGKAFHGLKMLLYQAVEAFELWNDCKVEEELCKVIYERMKGEMNIEE